MRTRSAPSGRSPSSTVASAFRITSSPVAAAMAILPLHVEVYDYELVDVLLITIPASIIGILAMSFVMSRHGEDLGMMPSTSTGLAAGEDHPAGCGRRHRDHEVREADARSSSVPSR